MNEINNNDYPSGRTRRKGGGRKDLMARMPDIAIKLRELVEPSIAGNPQYSILQISRSLRHLESEMNASGYEISYAKVGHTLNDMGFNLKGNRKIREERTIPINRRNR